MTEPIELSAKILGNTPSKSNCYRIIKLGNHASLGKTTLLKKYEESFFWQIGSLRDKMIDVPFEFYVDIYYPSKTNLIKEGFRIVKFELKEVSDDNR